MLQTLHITMAALAAVSAHGLYRPAVSRRDCLEIYPVQVGSSSVTVDRRGITCGIPRGSRYPYFMTLPQGNCRRTDGSLERGLFRFKQVFVFAVMADSPSTTAPDDVICC
jgi:hypothetical protein